MDFKYNDIKEKIQQLEYYLLTNSQTTVNALDLLKSIEDTLKNSVIIPIDQIELSITEEQTACRLSIMKGNLVGPSEGICYDSTNKEISEHRDEFDKYVRNELKNRLIDSWRY